MSIQRAVEVLVGALLLDWLISLSFDEGEEED